MKCSRCNSARYCSRECQVAHWKSEHRQACQNPTGKSIFVGEPPSSWMATSSSTIALSPSARSSARIIYDDTQRNNRVPNPCIYSMASRPSLLGYLEYHSNSTDGSFPICVANGEGSFISQVVPRFRFGLLKLETLQVNPVGSSASNECPRCRKSCSPYVSSAFANVGKYHDADYLESG